MKYSRLSYLSALIVVGLLLSPASERAETNQGSVLQKTRPENPKEPIKNGEEAAKQEPEKPTEFRSEIFKTLRAIGDRQRAAEEQARTEQHSWWSLRNIQIGLFLIGLAYTIFAGLQWWAIRRQANIAERGITQLERPWLIIMPGNPDGWDSCDTRNPGAPFRVRVNWSAKNWGRHPAFLLNLYVRLLIASIPSPDEQPEYGEVDPNVAEMVIPPGHAHGDEMEITINQADFESIRKQEKCIMFYGFARYNDTLHEGLHRTRFCSYWFMPDPNRIHILRFRPVGPRSYIEYT